MSVESVRPKVRHGIGGDLRTGMGRDIIQNFPRSFETLGQEGWDEGGNGEGIR